MAVIRSKTFVCNVCDHHWGPRSDWGKELPNICPECKSKRWNEK